MLDKNRSKPVWSSEFVVESMAEAGINVKMTTHDKVWCASLTSSFLFIFLLCLFEPAVIRIDVAPVRVLTYD